MTEFFFSSNWIFFFSSNGYFKKPVEINRGCVMSQTNQLNLIIRIIILEKFNKRKMLYRCSLLSRVHYKEWVKGGEVVRMLPIRAFRAATANRRQAFYSAKDRPCQPWGPCHSQYREQPHWEHSWNLSTMLTHSLQPTLLLRDTSNRKLS